MFRPWSPGEALAKGVWNIKVPATAEEVVPNVVIAPVVGFDRACYRLGYGGGFFDLTLATMKNATPIGRGLSTASASDDSPAAE